MTCNAINLPAKFICLIAKATVVPSLQERLRYRVTTAWWNVAASHLHCTGGLSSCQRAQGLQLHPVAGGCDWEPCSVLCSGETGGSSQPQGGHHCDLLQPLPAAAAPHHLAVAGIPQNWAPELPRAILLIHESLFQHYLNLETRNGVLVWINTI